MQYEILEKHPTADLRVYAIWFNMIASDARARWSPELINDPRVMYLWDDARTVGTFFGQNKPKIQEYLSPDSGGLGGDILWDAYLLYGPDARWDIFPSGLVRLGRTIIAATETLREDAERLLKK